MEFDYTECPSKVEDASLPPEQKHQRTVVRQELRGHLADHWHVARVPESAYITHSDAVVGRNTQMSAAVTAQVKLAEVRKPIRL
jgi:hypothetical protein